MKKVFDDKADMSAMTEMIYIFLNCLFARINFFRVKGSSTNDTFWWNGKETFKS